MVFSACPSGDLRFAAHRLAGLHAGAQGLVLARDPDPAAPAGHLRGPAALSFLYHHPFLRAGRSRPSALRLAVPAAQHPADLCRGPAGGQDSTRGAAASRPVLHQLRHLQYGLHRPAGQPGPVRRKRGPLCPAVFLCQHHLFLDHRQLCREPRQRRAARPRQRAGQCAPCLFRRPCWAFWPGPP